MLCWEVLAAVALWGGIAAMALLGGGGDSGGGSVWGIAAVAWVVAFNARMMQVRIESDAGENNDWMTKTMTG